MSFRPCRILPLLVLALVLGVVPAPSVSAGHGMDLGVDARFQSPSVTVGPGDTVWVPVKVQSTGDIDQTVRLRALSEFAGIEVALEPSGDLFLAPGESRGLTYRITVASGLPEGTYSAALEYRSETESAAESGQIAVEVHVVSRAQPGEPTSVTSPTPSPWSPDAPSLDPGDLELQILNATRTVTQGGFTSYSYRLVNRDTSGHFVMVELIDPTADRIYQFLRFPGHVGPENETRGEIMLSTNSSFAPGTYRLTFRASVTGTDPSTHAFAFTELVVEEMQGFRPVPPDQFATSPPTPFRPEFPTPQPVPPTVTLPVSPIIPPEGPIQIKPEPALVDVAPGSTVTVRYSVSNTGPSPAALTFQTSSHTGTPGDPGIPQEIVPASVSLDGGATITVEVRVAVSPEAFIGVAQPIVLRGLYTAGALESQLTSGGTVYLNVVDPAPLTGNGEPVADGGLSTEATVTLAVGGTATVVGAAFLLRRDNLKYLTAVGALPLYTRLAKTEVLEHDIRDRLYQHIVENPGVHYSAMKDHFDLNAGTLVHHLRTLERHQMIVSRREGFLRRFYPVGKRLPELSRPPLTPTQQKIMALVPPQGVAQKVIAERMGLTQQGANYHVKTLERNGYLVIRFQRGEWRCIPVMETEVVQPSPAPGQDPRLRT